MRNKMSLWKRSLAALLSFAMLLGMVPALDIVPQAEAYTHTDVNTDPQGGADKFIAMPITIRDFPADGMLFEYNEYTGNSNGSPTTYTASTEPDDGVNVLLNPSTVGHNVTLDEGETTEVTDEAHDLFSFILTETGSVPTDFSHEWWKTIYVNSDGTINRVYESAVKDTDMTIPTGGFMIAYFPWNQKEGTESVGNRYDYEFYSVISDATKDKYTFAYDQSSPAYGDANLYRYDATAIKSGEYYYANTLGYGLLSTNDNSYHNVLANNNDAIAGTTYLAYGGYNYSPDDMTDSNYTGQNAYLPQENGKTTPQWVYGALVRTGLTKPTLDANKNLVYTQATVDFLADYMEKTLTEVWQNEDGSYNLWYVMGDKLFDNNNQYVGKGNANATRDLAAVLRSQITGGMGTYTEAQAAFGTDALDSIQDIDTYYDAAYFLLHSTFNNVEGYGLQVPQYTELRLVEKTKTNADGSTSIYYVFNSAFDDTKYDPVNHYIINTQTANITDRGGDTVDDAVYTRGNIQALHRFDPLGPSGLDGGELGYGMSGSLYKEYYNALGIGGAASDHAAGYYENTNYNLSLEGHAQFVYHVDSNQYFTFTGDDDVYLFINGTRVLDLGGAHAIGKIGVNLNDVAELCGLSDGGIYDFDFYYMERHGTAANFGIETNIQIADPSMHTTKTGYQGGVNTGYGGPVDARIHVGYSFELQNDGDHPIYNLTFRDGDIGVYLSKDEITLYPDDFTDEDKSLYNINDLYLVFWNGQGQMTEFVPAGSVTVDILKDHLKAGLEPGEHIGIYGFKYKIRDNQWHDSGEDVAFVNTVYTTATPNEDGSGVQLNGVSDWKVVKMEVPYTPFHVYDWVHKDVTQDTTVTAPTWESHKESGMPFTTDNTDYGVTVEFDDLIKFWEEEVNSGDTTWADVDKATIVRCTGSGHEQDYNQNPNVSTDGKNITYTSTTVGKDTVFFKFKGIKDKNDNLSYDHLVFSFEVYTYGAVDNVYVLDYGLSVELAGDKFGYHTNDHLELNENSRPLTAVITGIVDDEGNDITSQEGTYGDFTWVPEKDEAGNVTGGSLKYTPSKIIDNTDEVYAKFRIVETDEEGNELDFSIFTGVEMVQKITTAPASVVYYEEDFLGITYISEGENQWVHYETVDENGEPVKGTEQSADQNMNYGSDPNYAEDEIGWSDEEASEITFKLDTSDHNAFQQSAISALSEYLGLSDEDSNGTVNKLVVKEKDDVMWFDFVGTGFEIVSRTTNDQYAVLKVSVHLIDENGNKIINQKDSDKFDDKLPATNADGRVAVIPVITESKGGTLYQVPIISLTGMPKARYRVTVTAAGNSDGTRILYIDGIRIYGPLSDGEALEYYNPKEFKAVFYEIKDLIYNYQAIYLDYYAAEDGFKWGTGVVMIENTIGADLMLTDMVYDEELQDTRPIEPSDYMSIGPNNEIYVDGDASSTMIAFFLTPDEDVPVAERTVQIGAHRKADSWEGYDDNVSMFYGSTLDLADVEDITEEPYYHLVTSGTEQYFDIDVQYLKQDAQGKYLVMIVANGSDNIAEVLTLTNLKVKGYTIDFNLEALVNDDKNGTLDQNPLVGTTFALMRALVATEEDPEVETDPVNENLVITSAALKVASVAPGKTATLSVKASSEAATIVVTDAAGNVVEYTRCTPKATSTGVTFTFLWKVSGKRGDVQTYTIRVYDAEGRVSVNTETVTLTIR